jgi:hypothetical protein
MIEGKLTIKAACGHEVTTEFGAADYDGISFIAKDITRRPCHDCQIAARRYRLTQVSIAESTPHDAYIIDNERWNGWVIPFFTREQVGPYLACQNTVAEYTAVFDEAKDAVIVKCWQGEDEPEEAVGVDITVDGETLHVYPIGAFSWIWEEVE